MGVAEGGDRHAVGCPPQFSPLGGAQVRSNSQEVRPVKSTPRLYIRPVQPGVTCARWTASRQALNNAPLCAVARASLPWAMGAMQPSRQTA